MSRLHNGIDVSEWQNDIDWAKVKESGITFAIIRAGYGENNLDAKAIRNVTEARKQGLYLGLYWYSHPLGDIDKPSREGKYAAEFAQRFPAGTINMPIWYDLEQQQEGTQTREFVQQCAINFCRAVQERGFDTGVYYNGDYFTRYYGEAFFQKYSSFKRWYVYPDAGATTHNYDMWQYSWKGRVPGIDGDVDMDTLDGNITRRFPVWLLFKMRGGYLHG